MEMEGGSGVGWGGGQFGEQSMNYMGRKYLKNKYGASCANAGGFWGVGVDWMPAVSQEQPNRALMGALLRNIDSANSRPHLFCFFPLFLPSWLAEVSQKKKKKAPPRLGFRYLPRATPSK